MLNALIALSFIMPISLAGAGNGSVKMPSDRVREYYAGIAYDNVDDLFPVLS